MEMDRGAHRWEAWMGWSLKCQRAEVSMGGAEGQLHGPPQNTLEDAGGTWGHILEAR